MNDFAFVPMTLADVARFDRWRALPHVRRWWSDADSEPAIALIGDPAIDARIIRFGGEPIGFLQDYDVHAWGPHHFDYLPAGSRGLDLFVGEADMVGKGLGPALLREYLADGFARGVPAFGIDPHPENHAARKAFAKAGFVETGGPALTPWGQVMLMEAWADRAG